MRKHYIFAITWQSSIIIKVNLFIKFIEFLKNMRNCPFNYVLINRMVYD